MRWVGPRHYRKGRLEIGRMWFAWRGWSRPIRYSIGSTRVFAVGPVAVFVGAHRRPALGPRRVVQQAGPLTVYTRDLP